MKRRKRRSTEETDADAEAGSEEETGPAVNEAETDITEAEPEAPKKRGRKPKAE